MDDHSEMLLKALKDTANALGRTPIKKEFARWRELKRHFDSWEKAIKAAGLASANSPEQHNIRAKQRSSAMCATEDD